MVALIATPSRTPSARPTLTLVPPPVERRQRTRVDAALACWLSWEAVTVRGHAVDLSTTGALIGGCGMRIPVGARAILKTILTSGEPPVSMRVHVVRYDVTREFPRLAVRILEANWADAFTLGGIVDRAQRRAVPT